MRIWASIVVFFSGYAPLAFLLAILNISTDANAGTFFAAPIAAYCAIGVAVVSLVFLWVTVSILHGDVVVEVIDVEDRSPELLNYSIPYIGSFALGNVLSDWKQLLVVCLFLAMLCGVSTLTRVVFLNPVLVFFGYGLYGVEIQEGDRLSKRLILSRSAPSQGTKLRVCALSRSLLFGEPAFNHV